MRKDASARQEDVASCLLLFPFSPLCLEGSTPLREEKEEQEAATCLWLQCSNYKLETMPGTLSLKSVPSLKEEVQKTLTCPFPPSPEKVPTCTEQVERTGVKRQLRFLFPPKYTAYPPYWFLLTLQVNCSMWLLP